MSVKKKKTADEQLIPHKGECQNSSSRISQQDEFPVIGIGASAGGMAALEAFFVNMPVDNNIKMSFVLIQHLPRDYKSILHDLLKKYTHFNIYEVAEGMAVAPHSIYIPPPGKDVVIREGMLYLIEQTDAGRLHLPIDTFFRSLALDRKEKSACIIFSGSGTDGTMGLLSIKEEGGMAMVQDPETAEYNCMLQTAIATDQVDYVLPPEGMPAQLISYIKHFSGIGNLPDRELSSDSTGILQKILVLLHAQTGHDFSGYKQSTIGRRIKRRLAVNEIERLDDYLSYLHKEPSEVDALFRELLVGVTGFFRDAEAFKALREKIIPRLFTQKTPGEFVRIWVPACSTGEEAYSIAILIHEYLEETKQAFKIQIFATDIDSRAIYQARAGIYPLSIAAYIPPEMLKKYFILDHNGNVYNIHANIREMLVFAEHNVSKDPPFSRLDLISCRNLLIYMDRQLQQKILHLFHYALNENGFLLLGTSEATGDLMKFFISIDKKNKIYQNQNRGSILKRPAVRSFSPLEFNMPARNIHNRAPKNRKGIREIVERVLLQRYTPACVVINKHGEILYFHGRTGNYLEPAPGEVSMNIMHMAREGLKPHLTNIVRKAVMQNEPVHCRGLKVRINETITTVDITVSPISENRTDASSDLFSDLFKVVFEEIHHEDDQQEADSLTDNTVNEQVAFMERELLNKEQYLQTVIEQLEASNEELQSANEEYQSTNEEMETTKEELQSVNEELITVNAELQKKIEQLSWANNNMNNLLAGTGMGTVFVDHELRIQHFTPLATRIINLIGKDLGRPLTHIASNLVNYTRLAEDVQEVLDTLIMREVEVLSNNNDWYLMRILPYRTLQNVIKGAAITFVDITEKKKNMDEVSRLAVVVRDSSDAVIMHDLAGHILAWNPGASKIYGWSETEALNMNIREIVPKGRRQAALKMVKKLASNEKLDSFQMQRINRDGDIINVWTTATLLINQEEKPYAIAITERIKNPRKGDDHGREQI